jgi:GH25 family lysozyme M1 (1,4-beta-N-acetylmuramidase)
MLPIMDVSRWQGSIDLDKVKASGLYLTKNRKDVTT